MKPGAIGVAAVAIALVAGGLFFGLGGSSGEGGANDPVPLATLAPSTVAPPAPAVVATAPGSTSPDARPPATFPEGAETLPVPNVIGVGQATAEARLADFEVAVVTIEATDADFFDEVTEQRPAAAERLPAGGTVTITIALQATPETVPADPLPISEFSAVDLDALQAGECGNGAVVDDVFVYERVECDELHDVQLITRFDVENAPDDYDRLALLDLVRDQCEQPYEDFVGVEPDDSQLSLSTIQPLEELYESEGERESLCVVRASGPFRIEGSAAGSLW